MQVPGVTDLGLKPRPVKKVAVIGGGLMGSGIVTALIMNNVQVFLKEVNDKFLEQGICRVKGDVSSTHKGHMFCSRKVVPICPVPHRLVCSKFT